MVDFILIGLTLAVALISIVWENPPTRAKVALIIFALATSGASVYKIIEDNQDKRCLQLALTSTLTPSNSDYHRFYGEITEAAKKFGLDEEEYDCHHMQEGLTCF